MLIKSKKKIDSDKFHNWNDSIKKQILKDIGKENYVNKVWKTYKQN